MSTCERLHQVQPAPVLGRHRVYVPQSRHASGAAFYWFSAGSANPQNRMADFTIDQKASQGQ